MDGWFSLLMFFIDLIVYGYLFVRLIMFNQKYTNKKTATLGNNYDSVLKKNDYSETPEIPKDIPDISNLFPDYETDIKNHENNKFFENRVSHNLDALLTEYIETKLDNKDALHPKNIKQLTIIRLIFSIITFLICSYICLYHEYIIICGIIEIVALRLYRKSIKKINLLNYIKKEILSRPDDNMDYIIESIKQQAVVNHKNISSVFLPFTIVLCCLIFLRPHIIYEKNETGYSVRYYTLALLMDAKVEIPDEYKGEKVNEIRGKTFYNMFIIKEVKLPKYITEIRGDTFKNSGLKKIEIPEGVTRIGGHAFYGCRNLSDVVIPDSLQSIGSSAFRKCESLINIRLPQHTSINVKTFKESPTIIERYEVDE